MKGMRALSNPWGLAALLLVAALLPLWHLHVIDRTMPDNHSDLLPRLVGTRDALQGMNPYSPRVLRDIQTAYYGRPLTAQDRVDPQYFLYPAVIVPVLAPFAKLPWSSVRLGFIVTIFLALSASTRLWMRLLRLRWPGIPCAAAVGLSVLNLPAMWGLRLQQPSLLVVVLMAGVCGLLANGQELLAGGCVPLLLIKPQISLPLILWLLTWMLMHRCWRGLAAFLASLGGLLMITEHLVPGWFPSWLQVFHGYSQLAMPELEILMGKWIGLGLTAMLILWSFRLLWKMLGVAAGSEQFGQAVALTLAVTAAVNPTKISMIYNEVLLVPGVLWLIAERPKGEMAALFRRMALMFVAWGFIALPVAVLGELVWPEWKAWQILPFRNLLLPVILAAALLLVQQEKADSGVWRMRWKGLIRLKTRENKNETVTGIAGRA
jgi:hypothetical protein